MERIYIKNTPENVGEEVKVNGWVGTRRDHGKLIFIDFVDATGVLQVVFTPANKEELKIANTLRTNDSIEISPRRHGKR